MKTLFALVLVLVSAGASAAPQPIHCVLLQKPANDDLQINMAAVKPGLPLVSIRPVDAHWVVLDILTETRESAQETAAALLAGGLVNGTVIDTHCYVGRYLDPRI